MRNIIPIALLCLMPLFGSGQDTIQVAKMYTTVIIFPETVSETILGNDLSFVIQQDGATDYGKRILKASYNKIGKEKTARTNLVVITESGAYYEFILSKSEKPVQLTYKIEAKDRSFDLTDKIANDKRSVVVENAKHKYSAGKSGASNELAEIPQGDESNLATDELYMVDKDEYYRIKCYYNQFNKPLLWQHFKRTGDVFLRLGGVYYHKDELYFQVIIDNQEPIDYDVNFVHFSIATNYKKSSSDQSTEIPPLYTYKVPKKVKGFSKNHFFVVFGKFTLDKHKVFKIDLDEMNGNRNITLLSNHKIVNRPKRF